MPCSEFLFADDEKDRGSPEEKKDRDSPEERKDRDSPIDKKDSDKGMHDVLLFAS